MSAPSIPAFPRLYLVPCTTPVRHRRPFSPRPSLRVRGHPAAPRSSCSPLHTTFLRPRPPWPCSARSTCPEPRLLPHAGPGSRMCLAHTPCSQRPPAASRPSRGLASVATRAFTARGHGRCLATTAQLCHGLRLTPPCPAAPCATLLAGVCHWPCLASPLARATPETWRPLAPVNRIAPLGHCQTGPSPRTFQKERLKENNKNIN